MNLSLFLIALSGIFWTITYIASIQIGFKQRTFAIPFWALSLNFAWELLCSILGYAEMGFTDQVIVNIVWLIFDIFILITYFKFGRNESNLSNKMFYLWSIIGILTSIITQYLFIKEFGLVLGSSYSAFLQNLLMSILFIDLLNKRQSSKGQTMLIAISKCLGTIAPTILFGYIGSERIGGQNNFILGIGLLTGQTH